MNKEISDFILDIGKKIEEISGAKLNFPQEATVPKEEWIAEDPKVMTLGGISLRTAEQTQNMDVVQLKKFDPCFLVEQPKIPCRVPKCPETTTVPSSSEEGRIKRDLFLCKTHREELADRILKRCAQENVTVDVTSFKTGDFKGYTSLIAALEKAFMHLKSKRLTTSGTTDSQLAEVFLNARNFLMITNSLLNPHENNVVIVLNACLKILSRLLEDSKNVENWRKLLGSVMMLVLGFYGIIYPWVMVSVENPGAKIGLGVGILFFLVFALRLDNVPISLKFILGGVLFPFAMSLIVNGVYDWNADPHLIEQRRQHIAQEQQQFIANLISWFSAPADDSGNLYLKIEQKK